MLNRACCGQREKSAVNREFHEIAKEARFIVVCDWTQTMNGFLEVALRQAAIPYRRATHLATFAHKEITLAKAKALSILGAEIHLGEISRIDVVPLDINVSQV